jgi:hypothetical protein
LEEEEGEEEEGEEEEGEEGEGGKHGEKCSSVFKK